MGLHLWVCGFQRHSSPMDVSEYKSRVEGGTERMTERVRERGRRNTLQHGEDSRKNSASIVQCGLLNILMMEPHPDPCHKLHTDSHND